MTEPSGDSTAFLPWRNIVRMAAGDHACEGLLINPGYQAPHGGIIFLKKEILTQIIRYAEETINGMPENVREALIKGI